MPTLNTFDAKRLARYERNILNRELNASRVYFADTISWDCALILHREMQAWAKRGDIPQAELAHNQRLFVEDAIDAGVSYHDMVEGMKAFRNSGNEFLPHTFGAWKKVVDQHVHVSGRDLHESFDRRVSQALGQKAYNPEYDTSDNQSRKTACFELQEETRRVGYHLKYKQGLPSLSDLKTRLKACERVPVDERDGYELTAISGATHLIHEVERAASRARSKSQMENAA